MLALGTVNLRAFKASNPIAGIQSTLSKFLRVFKYAEIKDPS